MKHLIKSGRVAVWIVGEGSGYMVLAEDDVTEEELVKAVEEEELVQEFRMMGAWN